MSFRRRKNAEYGRELLRFINNQPECIVLSDYVEFILSHWDCLLNYTRTYRALADIATIMGTQTPDTPESRCKYAEILRTIATDWRS